MPGSARGPSVPWMYPGGERGDGHVGNELLRLRTPAVLLLGPLRSVADVLGPSSRRPHFPHMA